MDQDAPLRADCGRCAGLCCVALAFDRSPLFAEDKPAGAPCRHLGSMDRCVIHGRRAESGFAGCVHYDCLGVGQLVTQDLFAGRSWRDCTDGGKAMFAAFARMRRVQEWRAMLQLAACLPLTPALLRRRQMLLRRLSPGSGWTVQRLDRADSAAMAGEMADFLKVLRCAVGPMPPASPH